MALITIIRFWFEYKLIHIACKVWQSVIILLEAEGVRILHILSSNVNEEYYIQYTEYLLPFLRIMSFWVTMKYKMTLTSLWPATLNSMYSLFYLIWDSPAYICSQNLFFHSDNIKPLISTSKKYPNQFQFVTIVSNYYWS